MPIENQNPQPSDDQPSPESEEENTLHSEPEEDAEFETVIRPRPEAETDPQQESEPESKTAFIEDSQSSGSADDEQTVITQSSADGLETNFVPGLQSPREPIGSDGTVVTEDEGRTVNLEQSDSDATAEFVDDDDERTVITSDDDDRTAHVDAQSENHDAESDGQTTMVRGESPRKKTISLTEPTSGSATKTGAERYELVDNFARGGLGNIWLAHDVSIRREVAYKELLPQALRNHGIVERFLEEAQITGQLEHPGIVPIYEMGEQANGTPFYSMKLVRGETMELAIEAMHKLPKDGVERNLVFKKLLGDFIDVCNAIGFAHNRGVLHRDLKPLNVMLGDFGETLVLDWGLAKIIGVDDADEPLNPATSNEAETSESTDIVDEEQTLGGSLFQQQVPGNSAASMTGASQSGGTRSQSGSGTFGTGASRMTTGATGTGSYHRQSVSTDVRTDGSRTMMGSIMGTPSYMPPEQAKGQVAKMDARTDIYSLGGILYKLLTNEVPIGSGKLNDVLKEIADGNITPPRQIDSSIPRPLEAACLKAMSKTQDDRYQSALDLAADVEAWLADEPVSCYDEPLADRASRWMRRHTTFVLTTAVAVFLLIVGGFGFAKYESNRIEGLRKTAEVLIGRSELFVQRQDFETAQEKLVEALGVVASAEESLSDLKSAVEAQQAIVQNHAIEFQRKQFESQIEAAQQATGTKAYDKAKQILNEAAGSIQSVAIRDALQPRIDEQFLEIENRIQDDERQRIATLSNELNVELSKADSAYRVDGDAERAKILLTRIVSELKSKPKLAELRTKAQNAIQLIDNELAAQSKLHDFELNRKQARYYEGLIVGDSRTRFLREARRYALIALKAYGVDDSHALKLPIPHLLATQTQSIQTGVLELVTIMAESEVNLVPPEDTDARKAAAQQALGWLAIAKQAGVELKSVYLHEAAYYELLGNVGERDQAIEKAAKIKASSTLDFYQLGSIELVRHNTDEALEQFRMALELEPDHFESLCSIGQCHMLNDNLILALPSYTAAIAARPDFPYPYTVRGLIYARFGQSDNALADFDKAIAIQPDLCETYLNRGAAFLILKRYNESIADSQRAAQLRPDWAAPLLNLAEAHYRRGEDLRQTDGDIAASASYESALVELTNAAKISLQHPLLYRLRGDVNTRLKVTANAIEDYQTHIRLDHLPNRIAESHKQIGAIHYSDGKFDEALAAYDESLRLNPNDSAAVRLRAEVLLAQGQRAQAAGNLKLRQTLDQQAINTYSKFLKMAKADFMDRNEKSKPIGVFVSRGLANARAGRYRDAINDYTLSLEFEPAPNIFKKRGFAYLLSAHSLALEDFNDAVRLNPQDPENFNGRGYARAVLGNYQEAIADAKQAAKLTPAILKQQGAQAWPIVFNTATIYGQAVKQVEKDEELPTAEREELAKQYTVRAIQLIKSTFLVAGRQHQSNAIKQVLTDEALEPIRDRDEFKAAFKFRKKSKPPQPDKPR